MPNCIDCGKPIQDIYERCYNCNIEYKKNATSNKVDDNELSEGELFLKEYFQSEGIRYKTNHVLDNLKNDGKNYRLPDFYLPTFKLHVEYLGMWFVSEEQKNRYREKKRVYKINKIPCVYIYPENLGIIDFILPLRAIKTFKDYSLTKELWLFRLKFLWLYKKENIILLIFILYVLVFGSFKWEEDDVLIWIMIGTVAYQIFNIGSFYQKKLC